MLPDSQLKPEVNIFMVGTLNEQVIFEYKQA